MHMAPKKAKQLPEPDKFETGDIVLCKVKGYPEWPGKVQNPSTASDEVKKARQGKAFLVRFFPDADYYWFGAREMKQLTPKAIDAYLSDSSKKAGKLRMGYEVARDPSEWEAEQARLEAEQLEDDEEDEDEDVDMLAEDGEERPSAAGKKRKRTAAEPKKKAGDKLAKKDGGSKKRKTDDASDKKAREKPVKGSAASVSKDKDKKPSAIPAGEDTSEGAKTVKGWRATLQKAFLTKGIPPADKMSEFDKIFTLMENFEMQSEWLTMSKLGKVLKRMSILPEIERDVEFKIRERSNALIEKWRDMMVKEGGDETAGDITIAAHDDAKEEAKAEKKPEHVGAKPAAEEKKETNGNAHPDEKMETDAQARAPPSAAAAPTLNGVAAPVGA